MKYFVTKVAPIKSSIIKRIVFSHHKVEPLKTDVRQSLCVRSYDACALVKNCTGQIKEVLVTHFESWPTNVDTAASLIVTVLS